MTSSKFIQGIIAFGQAALFPLLYVGWGSIHWQWQLFVLLAMTVAIVFQQFSKHTLIATGVAFILGLVGSIGHWQLLPLVIAQVVFGLLLGTQSFSARARLSLWFVQVYFLQVILITSLTQVLTRESLLIIGFLLAPFLIVLWADKLPAWGDLILLIGLVIAGYLTQSLTLSASLALVVLPAFLSTRRHAPVAIIYNGLSLLSALILAFSRLHG